MRIEPSTAAAARRREFAAFLRSRRERVTPASVGLSNGVRRRTPGLRREEVAELAGVGVTWYTWLEQARAVNPSVETLDALADTLRLDAAERRHLFVLAGRPPSFIREAGPEAVSAPIRRMLDSLTLQPALVTGRRWDILAWNRAAEAVFGDYRRLEGDERNMMHLMFANAAHRAMLVDWRTVATNALATFRADYARYRGDADFERLIATLSAASAEFRQGWAVHEVLPPIPGCKRIMHPTAGRMAFEYTTFVVADADGQRLAVFAPLVEEDTERKLAALLNPPEGRSQGRRDRTRPPTVA
ncbi:helix-turn-helix transcriptional regulator [Roseiarcus fermentans]|nr:helix-turn-helix transcriptional regulator [Roseiarcus fermentans]